MGRFSSTPEGLISYGPTPMRRLLLPIFALASLTTVGCGQSFCDRVGGAHDSLASKAAPCGVNVGKFNAASCKVGVGACSSNDQTQVSFTLDCISKLPTCAPVSQISWEQQLSDCQTSATVSTAACKQAVSFQ